jgi:hypothetical protein
MIGRCNIQTSGSADAPNEGPTLDHRVDRSLLGLSLLYLVVQKELQRSISSALTLLAVAIRW